MLENPIRWSMQDAIKGQAKTFATNAELGKCQYGTFNPAMMYVPLGRKSAKN